MTVVQGMEAGELNSKQFHENLVVHGVDKIGAGQSKNMDSQKKVESSLPCPHCAEFGHWARTCRFRTTQCKKCGKIGHIARACRSSGVTEHKKPQGNSFKSRKSILQLAEETTVSGHIARAYRSSGVTEHKKPQGNSFKSRKSTYQLAEETTMSEEVDMVEDGIDCGNYSLNNIYLVSNKAPIVWVLVCINGVAVKWN